MAETKICPSCGEEIKAIAKKCPHCQSWQSKWRFDPTSPRHQLVWSVIILAVMWLFFSQMFWGEDIEKYRSHLIVVDSEMSYGRDDCGSSVSVIGKLRNDTDIAWENVHFETRFYDSDNRLIDTISDSDYDFVVLPNADAAFRVRGRADKPEESYHRFEIIVKKAREAQGWL